MDLPILTRSDALERGLKRYFEGKPCKHGHIVERFTSSTWCVECKRLQTERWREANPSKSEEVNKRGYLKNKDKLRAHNLFVKDNHPERFAAYRRKIEANRLRKPEHLALRKAISNRYRAKKIAAEGFFSREDVLLLLDQQNSRCACCFADVSTSYHVDHIVALSRGGSNWPSNLQILCPTCNRVKKDRPNDVFMAERRAALGVKL